MRETQLTSEIIGKALVVPDNSPRLGNAVAVLYEVFSSWHLTGFEIGLRRAPRLNPNLNRIEDLAGVYGIEFPCHLA